MLSEKNFIAGETKPSPETIFESKKGIVGFILNSVPSYMEEQLDVSIGDGQTTLNQFLEKANDGSEWTDPHGFKINIMGNKFRILINNEQRETGEEFLSNTAFQNFSSGFETYQRILKSDANKEEVMQRMHALYERLNKQEKSKKIEELRELIYFVLSAAENNKFSKEEFAKKISSLSIAEDFRQEWNKKAGDTAGDLTMLNNVLAFRVEKDGNISLHIRPTDIKANELLRNIKEGIVKLLEEIKKGNIQGKNIVMKSWLLNGDYEAVIERFFGKKLDFKDVPDEDDDVLPAQHLALQYNSRELKKYLKTGKRPKVRKVELTREEILDKFNGGEV